MWTEGGLACQSARMGSMLISNNAMASQLPLPLCRVINLIHQLANIPSPGSDSPCILLNQGPAHVCLIMSL